MMQPNLNVVRGQNNSKHAPSVSLCLVWCCLLAPLPPQVASKSHMSDATRAFVERLQSPNFESMGSSLKLVLVAEGRAALYPRMAPTNEWDTAAAHAIVMEAGGRVLQAGRCDDKGEALEDWEVRGVL